MTRLQRIFGESGLLIHMLALQDAKTRTYIEKLLRFETLDDVRVENDCGAWCSAYTYLSSALPVITFSFRGWEIGGGMIYAANDAVWNTVQCSAVTDSTATSRACCACYDRTVCPWWGMPETDSGYCNTVDLGDDVGVGCAAGDENCKHLAAACGVSLYDVAGHDGSRLDESDLCSRDEVISGSCDLCTRPVWCFDEAQQARDGHSAWGMSGQIRTPRDWMDEFAGDDHAGKSVGARQCMWKRSQRELFIDTMRLHFTEFKNGEFWSKNLWNEVSVYVGPNDGGASQILTRDLVGLLFVRGLGTDWELQQLRRIADHFRTLGKELPIYTLTTEPENRVNSWDPGHPVDLREEPYWLEVLE